MWTDEFVGIPYVEGGRSKDGTDCLGLIVLAAESRYGVCLPDPRVDPKAALRRAVVASLKPLFDQVPVAQEGDILLFRIEGRPLHVGMALNTRLMLHAERGIGSCIEDYTRARWASRLEGIYRFAGRS